MLEWTGLNDASLPLSLPFFLFFFFSLPISTQDQKSTTIGTIQYLLEEEISYFTM